MIDGKKQEERSGRFRGTLDSFARSQRLEDVLPFLRGLAEAGMEGRRSIWSNLAELVLPRLREDHRTWDRVRRRVRDLSAYLEVVRRLALSARAAGDGETLALARRHWADVALELPSAADRFRLAVAYLREDPHSLRAAFLAFREAEALGKIALARKFGRYVDSLYVAQRVRGAVALVEESPTSSFPGDLPEEP